MIMLRRYYGRLLPGLLMVAVLGMAGCATTSAVDSPGSNDFHVLEHTLYRGDDPYVVQAFHVPDVLRQGAVDAVKLPAMAQIAAVGGNVLATDLHWSAEQPMMDAAMMESVSELADRARSQRMGVLVRLDVGVRGDNVDVHEALRNAAAHLQGERRAVYWVDSSDPAHVTTFQSAAPLLAVAATEGGNIRVLRDLVGLEDAMPMLFVNQIPLPAGLHSFVLADVPENYETLDQALMHEVEEQPWTPNNTILSEEEQAEGYVALFNGENLDGWWIWDGDDDVWSIGPEGTLDCLGGSGGAMYTRDRYSDYTLKLEYQIVEDGNSGIFNRAPRAARQSWIGFEFQILGDYGAEPDDQSTGSIYDQVAPTVNASNPPGEWNEVEIELIGSQYRAWLNGIQIQDIDFEEHEELQYRLREGFIGLQDHNDPVSFRNIRILEH